MFKLPPFLPIWISPTNTELDDLENQGQGHFQLMIQILSWALSDSL